jgi:hypothetical protein
MCVYFLMCYIIYFHLTKSYIFRERNACVILVSQLEGIETVEKTKRWCGDSIQIVLLTGYESGNRINLAQEINQCWSLFKRHEPSWFVHVEEFLSKGRTGII